MKKFTDVENYSIFTYGLIFILIALLFVSVAILGDYINSLFTGKEPSYSIQTQITSIVLAFSTIILVIITAGYAKSTKKLLDEQVILRKIASIEKVLENVYSPMNNALNEFRLQNDNLPNDKIPENYDRNFQDLYNNFQKIDVKYHHLFDQKIIKCDIEIWGLWNQYIREKNIPNYKLLNSRIDKFNDVISHKIDKNKLLLKNFQILGEPMNHNDKNIDSKDLVKAIKNAMDKEDLSFLDINREKSDLQFMKKCVEIKIFKENSDIEIQLCLYALGLSLFLYGNQIIRPPDFLLKSWSIVGIIIIIIGLGWSYFSQIRTKKQKRKLEFMLEMILQIEKRLK